MLLAVGLRLALLGFLAEDPLVGDSLQYQLVAQNLIHHGQIDTYWPPGMPLFLAGIMKVFGESTIWLRLAMLPWFLWLCQRFYGLAYRMHSRPAANLGLLLLALFPAMIHQSVEPLSYLPAAALLLAIFDLVQRYLDKRRRGQLLRMGICLGLLILFRPSAALFLLALPALILIRRKKFLPGFTLTFATLLIVGGWIFVASRDSGRFIPVNEANSRNLYLGNNAWTPEYKTWYFGSHWTGDPSLPLGFRQELDSLDRLPADVRSRAFGRMAMRDMTRNPAGFLWRTGSRIRTLLAFDSFAGTRLLKDSSISPIVGYAVLAMDGLVYVTILLMSVAFLFSVARRELPGRDIALTSGFLLTYALPYLISFSHPTYHLPMVPLMLLYASIWGSVCLRGEYNWSAWRRRWHAWLVLLLLIGIQVEWAIRMA
ncbi:MAG: hypothetical protein RLZZ519_475 [Bacteroidota bacterium]|jgi:4-amino-4-deoxy-L-arabinose transferase-like glycosyltransferase